MNTSGAVGCNPSEECSSQACHALHCGPEASWLAMPRILDSKLYTAETKGSEWKGLDACVRATDKPCLDNDAVFGAPAPIPERWPNSRSSLNKHIFLTSFLVEHFVLNVFCLFWRRVFLGRQHEITWTTRACSGRGAPAREWKVARASSCGPAMRRNTFCSGLAFKPSDNIYIYM